MYVEVGLLLIILGLLFIIIGSMQFDKKEFGGFVLIGPFPIVFGSNDRMVFVSLILLVVMLVMIWIFLRGL